MSDVKRRWAMTGWSDRAGYRARTDQAFEDWAWDFLRRNATYRAQFLRWAAGDREPDPGDWGLVAFCDPWT